MKKYFSLLASLCLTGIVFAQDVDIFWGKFNSEDRFASVRLIGRRGDKLFAYKKSKHKVSILKYSMSDLQVSAEYPLIGKSGNEGGKTISDDYEFSDIITLKNHFYVSVTKYDRSSKQTCLYIQEIDDNGRLTGSLKKMECIEAKSKSNQGDFDLIESRDSTKLLLVDYPAYDKVAGQKYIYTMFDENLNQIKKIGVELPFKDKDFDLDDISYEKDGNIYMMAKINLERQEKVKGESAFYYELVEINTAGDGAVLQYDVKLPQKYIDGISYNADDPKEIVCSGLYGDMTGTAKGQIKGIFYMRISKDNQQVVATGLKELDKDFIADLTSTRKANKGRGISNDFIMRNFIRRSDGGAILLAEYAYDYVVVTTTTDSHGGSSTTYTYHYIRNNIIAININPDGTIKWCADIPKFQHTTNDNGMYSSYTLATKQDRMYIIYNDNADNMAPGRSDDQNLKTMSSPKKSTAVLVELNNDGQFTKKALLNNKDNNVALMPSYYLKLSDDGLIVPAYNPGFWCCVSFSSPKSKLARITFK